VVAARPYARKLGEVLERLAQNVEHDCSPLLQQRAKDRGLLILVTSDRGLCGGFNANICKAADRFLKEKKGEFNELSVVTIGRKGHDFVKNRHTVRKNYANVQSSPNYQTAALIAHEVIDGFIAEEYDEVYLLFNAFRSVMSQDITLERLLPIAPPAGSEEAVPAQYIYEPSQGELLAELLPKHIEVQIFKALLESIAAEHGARMTAMDSASKNANEMIGKLTLIYNRARQAAITKELMEIISGAESVKG
jgi:F-type H+-transporting ATPase subunit gamma